MEGKEKQYIGTTETANILGVSKSTVRRLADSGKLNCYIISYNKYRKFKKEEVEKFKKKNMRINKNNDIIVQESTEQQLSLDIDVDSTVIKTPKKIKSKSHPAHYMMHKYWGRKPHNVVEHYIRSFTNAGDTVLDPFAGSGMAPIEAIKSNRKGIGVDINPMSKFIALNTISNVNLENYKEKANEILQELSFEYQEYYETKCPKCESTGYIDTAVWKEGKLERIRGKCVTDGVFIKDVDQIDREKFEEISNLKKDADLNGTINYPKDKVLKYVKRSGKESINELFTDRALVILSRLRDRIKEEKDVGIRELLLFTFTSMLANVSNMLPGDLEKATYRSGWVISKFWTPKIHTERNIFHCFKLRVNAIIRGKKELIEVKPDKMEYYISDSSNLSFIQDESVDYIFTDPPYGESIAYLALSQFWNSWLENEVDYKNEIIIDAFRKKDHLDYGERMKKTFSELYRVLKKDKYLSFTFHNRDLNVWKAVMDATKYAGFDLVDITLQEQAVSSGTQGINKMNTLTGDFVYTLKKVQNNQLTVGKMDKGKIDNLGFVKNKIHSLIINHRSITPSRLYEILIPEIVREEAYIDENGKAINIEEILKNNYEYVEDENKSNRLGDHFVWKIKD